MPGSNIPLAALGTLILWLGWFGFNGGSELVISDEASAIAVSQVFLNTNMAAAGVLGALILSLVMTGKSDVTMVINGAIAGLVAITAGPSAPTGGESVITGFIGGLIVYASILYFDKMKVDDPVGAISAHGTAGIFGVMVVPFTNADASFLYQFIGVISIAGFGFLASFGAVYVINMFTPIRASDEEQSIGTWMLLK